ncbi:concanavalin A-like lectin/glucanase domain-containing protein [Cladochytrium replicatum]|nr:concanavalin A-like lectin/glucanase domain-containing protein [Cladochytrium replicatum]
MLAKRIPQASNMCVWSLFVTLFNIASVTVVIVNNEAYACSEFPKCTIDNATIITTANVTHTCSEIAKSSALREFSSIIRLFYRRRMAAKAKANDPEYSAVDQRPAYSADSSWNNSSSTDYENARAFQASNPPPQESTPSEEQLWGIRDRGFEAWVFVSSDPGSVSTIYEGVDKNDDTTLGINDTKIGVQFHPSQPGKDCAVLTDLPLALDANGTAMNREFFYFEVTVEEISFHPHSTVVSVGLATRPYPPFRMIGHQKFSVGYHSDDGHCFVNDSYGGRVFGSPFSKGSVVGVGYVQATGSVFFTLNGALVGEATTIEERVFHPYHAAVAADGPATLSVNFGQLPFTYANANPATAADQGGCNEMVTASRST